MPDPQTLHEMSGLKIGQFPSIQKLEITQDMLSYYTSFERTQWAEVPAAAIDFYHLPLIMQKISQSTRLTYEFPALWKHERLKDPTKEGFLLSVSVKAESEIKLMDINLDQWYPGYRGTGYSCCSPAGDGPCICRPCPPFVGQDYVNLLSTFHRCSTTTLGTTGTGYW